MTHSPMRSHIRSLVTLEPESLSPFAILATGKPPSNLHRYYQCKEHEESWTCVKEKEPQTHFLWISKILPEMLDPYILQRYLRTEKAIKIKKD